jgi:hypothetical protein
MNAPNAPAPGTLPALQVAGAMTAGFGSTEMTAGIESASSAVAAQARAVVEARYIMALRRPRSWDDVRAQLIRECRRPTFAHNKSAFYRKPIGEGVEGLGIRFVEVALRCMTNVLVESSLVFEDAGKEIHRVTVTDLESNLTYPLDVRVTKTVERSKPMDDGSYISVRINSYKKPVYTVPANDDDLLNKRGALISKAIRTLGLRVIPGDLQDECEEIIKSIRMDEAARDPDAERKRIADAFGEIGVKPSALAEYLGHDLGSCSPAELVNLRGLYGAIKDGEATWASVMDNKAANGGEVPAPAGGAAPGAAGDASGAPAGRTAGVKERAKAAASSRAPAAGAAAQTAAGASNGSAPVVSFAQVEEGLQKAATVDALDEAASLIAAVGDAGQQTELTEIYRTRRASLAAE